MFSVWILLTLLPILGGAQRFNCKGRILGAYYADAKSGCKAFHVCVRVAGGGIRDFRFFCPPGTLFHQEAQTCTDWGDDDPLACPADIYDGFDTKKLSSYGNRDDEAEFGLQRAETGDRRLSQNNVASNRPDTDLRAAHSSDFFSGHRDRGVDETAHASQPPSHIPSSSTSQSPVYTRQSFRRPSTQRTFPPTQNTSPAPSAPSQPSSRPQNDGNGKRKLVRKRPIYVSNKSTISTISPNTITQENYPQTTKQTQQNYNLQNYNLQPNYNQKQNLKNENNFNRRGSTQARQSTTSTTSTPDVPPQYREYKDEYVEVSRVTPKQNRHYPNSMYNPQTTSAQKFNKKEGLIEFFNYDAQSTPGLNVQNENEPFKVKHSFNVANPPRDSEFARSKNDNFNSVKEAPTIIDYSVSTRGFPTTTTAYKNYNSVSYEPEKNNFLPYSKHNNFNNYPTTTAAPGTTIYTTSRPEPPPNLNTVAYNTNIGFNAQSNNYAESDEDDGQYHPPEGEDDGQYKPEIYNRELLEAAHSLNIAASGNRLPEDRKTYSKTRFSPKNSGHTIAPRPFKPAPITAQPTTTVPEIIYTTTLSPQTTYTQRTFDYIQTYTTTSRPADFLVGQTFAPTKEVPVRPTTTLVPRVTETRPPRPTSHAPAPPTQPQTAPPKPTTRPTNRAPTIPTHPKTTPPRPTTRPPNFAYPANKKEDNSYDYAYYDSDPGFVEYDHIEEFGKTNKKRS